MIGVALAFLLVPTLALALVVSLDDPPPAGNATLPTTGVRWFDGWLTRLRPWHAAAALVLSFLIIATAMVPYHDTEVPVLLALLLVAVLFLRAWRREFVLLMALGDDSFASRYDKLIWVGLMVLIPPLGLGVFRAYRRTYWPGLAPAATREAAEGRKPAPIPDLP